MLKTLFVNCFQYFNNIFFTFQESTENKYFHRNFENTRWTDSLNTVVHMNSILRDKNADFLAVDDQTQPRSGDLLEKSLSVP